MPARAKDVPPPPPRAPPRLEHLDARSGPQPHRSPARSRAATAPQPTPSIDALKLLARNVERQLVRGRPLVEGGPDDGAPGTTPVALKASLSRALETCVVHAKDGYRFLIKGEEMAAEDANGAELAARVSGRAPLATRDSVRMSRKKMYFTSAKAERELGYRPRPAQQAIADAVAWFRANGYLG